MQTQKSNRDQQIPNWAVVFLALPVFLMALSGVAEGFPAPLLPIWLMPGILILGFALAVFFVFKRWMKMGLFLYSAVMGFTAMIILDEIASSYKTPFTILAALLVLIPVIVYLFSGWRRRWDVLVIGGLLVILAITYISNRYWDMIDVIGFSTCYPDCLPVSGVQPAWWQVLIGAF